MAASTTSASSPASRNSRGAPASATNNRCAPRTATPAITPNSNSNPNPAAAPPRDGGSRTVSTASLSLSWGARAAVRHARLGTALASKMASASTSTVVQGWPNTKDDYELKEVIGEYRSPCETRPTEATIARCGRAEGRARATLERRPRLRERAPATAGRRSR